MAEKIDKDIQDEILDPKIRKAVQAARNDRLKALQAAKADRLKAMAAAKADRLKAMAAAKADRLKAMAAAKEEKSKGGSLSGSKLVASFYKGGRI